MITNLISAIPWIGQDIVEFIWGGFSVNNATLNRFFALHFVLPFVLAALALMHLIALHDSAGSGNPLGVSGNYDRLPFAPYFIFKDLITIFLFIVVLSVFVFFMPNVLGDSNNYIWLVYYLYANTASAFLLLRYVYLTSEVYFTLIYTTFKLLIFNLYIKVYL